jgi:putative transposase
VGLSEKLVSKNQQTKKSEKSKYSRKGDVRLFFALILLGFVVIYGMPRFARLVIPGCPHHVTQRGNRRGQVFFGPDDYDAFLRMADKYRRLASCRVQAYCLMPNHVHLVLVPERTDSLASMLKPLFTTYSQYLNVRLGPGRTWQGRYFSCPLDDPHLQAAVRYVEQNPVRAGLVTLAEQYDYSSAPARVLGRRDDWLDDPSGLTKQMTPEQWQAWLANIDIDDPIVQQQVETLRLATHTGKPAASHQFRTALEKKLKQPLKLRPQGRPKKTQ